MQCLCSTLTPFLLFSYVLEFLQWTENREMDWLRPFSDSWHLFCPPRARSSSKSGNSLSDDTSQNMLLHKKLLLLPRVCSIENACEVLCTLEETSWDRSDAILCRALLDCILSLVERLPQPSSSQALRLLIRFIESKEGTIVDNALETLEVSSRFLMYQFNYLILSCNFPW